MEQKKNYRKIITRLIIAAIIITAGIYGARRFYFYYQQVCIDSHREAIQWYIDNNKSGFEDFSTYEEYEEFIENGGTIEGRDVY